MSSLLRVRCISYCLELARFVLRQELARRRDPDRQGCCAYMYMNAPEGCQRGTHGATHRHKDKLMPCCPPTLGCQVDQVASTHARREGAPRLLPSHGPLPGTGIPRTHPGAAPNVQAGVCPLHRSDGPRCVGYIPNAPLGSAVSPVGRERDKAGDERRLLARPG